MFPTLAGRHARQAQAIDVIGDITKRQMSAAADISVHAMFELGYMGIARSQVSIFVPEVAEMTAFLLVNGFHDLSAIQRGATRKMLLL